MSSTCTPLGSSITVNGKSLPFAATLFWAGFVGLPYLPATAIPTGRSRDGLPIGIQIVGRHRDEWSVLQIAHAV